MIQQCLKNSLTYSKIDEFIHYFESSTHSLRNEIAIHIRLKIIFRNEKKNIIHSYFHNQKKIKQLFAYIYG